MQYACSSNFSKTFVRRNTTKIVVNSSTEQQMLSVTQWELLQTHFGCVFFSSFKDLNIFSRILLEKDNSHLYTIILFKERAVFCKTKLGQPV